MKHLLGDRFETDHLSAGIDRHVTGADIVTRPAKGKAAKEDGLAQMVAATKRLAEASERAVEDLRAAAAEVRRLQELKTK